MRGAFTETAVLRLGTTEVEGGDGIVEFFRGVWLRDPEDKVHVLTNVRSAAGEGDEVILTSYFVWFEPTNFQTLCGWGVYEDRVTFVDGIARIAEKSMAGSWNVDVPPPYILNGGARSGVAYVPKG